MTQIMTLDHFDEKQAHVRALVTENCGLLLESWNVISMTLTDEQYATLSSLFERMNENMLTIDSDTCHMKADRDALQAALMYTIRDSAFRDTQEAKSLLSSYIQRQYGRNQRWADTFIGWTFGDYEGVLEQFEENDFIASADVIVENIHAELRKVGAA